MMPLPWRSPLVVWAARDLLRHPVPLALLFVALASLTALMALVVLLTQALSTTVTRLTEDAPAVVVRRVSAGGWMPMPVQEGLSVAGQIPGVIRPRVRVWGVVGGATRPLTVLGLHPGESTDAALPDGYRFPLPGQALVGRGAASQANIDQLYLAGRQALTLTVIERLPANSAMAAHDVVLVHVDDARRLLGLNADQASDLVLDVFHAEAVEALCPELAAAFDWPVSITTRQAYLGRALFDIAGRGSLALLACVPALLAMALVALAVGAWGRRRKWELGLLKALGWSGGDILRLTLFRGLLVGVPALAAGAATAYLLLFRPAMTWAAHMLFGWSGPPPGLYLSAQGALAGLALAVLMVATPYLAMVFWTGWQGVAADPAQCVEEGR
jgi:hypothetical protein